ncbi:uncharacterized protein [Macrobrachium rosenbergii]|uniref:uncharacterized protein isoform X2 n=1 Tax=Macrobrachium rosenbergii TaxID=79674 RepID=UPI0034D61F11
MTRLYHLLQDLAQVLVATAGCLLIFSTTASGYNLQYYGGQSRLRDSFTVQGKAIGAMQAFMTQTHEKACDCRMACWAYEGCHSASSKPAGTKFECRLSHFYTQNLTLEDDPDSVFSYWLDPSWFLNHGVQDDGLLYISATSWFSYDYSMTLCAVQPGFRTIMLKTGKQQIIGKHILVKSVTAVLLLQEAINLT